MNLPNKLTVLRIVMIPVFVVFMLSGTFAHGPFTPFDKWIALALFIIASLTDFLDGRIARKYHLITNFGKLTDPLADKLLVSSALICLTALGKISAWPVILIIAREFIISGVRQVAADAGRVIAASYWGKFKTAFQMCMIILMIIDMEQLSFITMIVMYIAVALTLISLVDYLIKNRDVITSGGI